MDHRPERRTFPHTSLGRSVHKALRDFYALEPGDRTLGNLLHALRRAWEGSGFQTLEEAETARAKGQTMLRRYFELEDHARVRPIALESVFSFSHPRAGIRVTGRVDRLDAEGSDYVIVDYKTGRYHRDERDLDESLPLSIYAMAVSGRLGRDVARIRLHHLASGERMETVRGPDRLAADWQVLVRLVDEIRADDEMAARPGPLCRWCDYLSICPEGQREVVGEGVGAECPTGS